MWYKNAIIYLLPDGWQLEAGFAEKLEQAAFTPCMGLDWFSEGFAAPAPFSPELVFPADHTQRIALRRQERVLPTRKTAPCSKTYLLGWTRTRRRY